MIVLQATVLTAADNAAWFGFDANALPSRWWAALTYMFVHTGVWHFAANIGALFLFGPRLEQTWGSKRFAWFYLLCGLGGVLFQVLFVREGTMVGAAAAVFGVMTAYAMQWPEDELYLFGVAPIRARTLVGVLFGL